MNKIKSNKEIVILLVIIIYMYALLFLSGCQEKAVGNRVFTNRDLKVSLVCEYFPNEPFINLGIKGIEELKSKMDSKVVYLGVKEDYAKINTTINRVAMKNNVVIILGGWLRAPLQSSSRQLREKNFVVIDEVIDEANVQSISFKNQEGAYLMGIIGGGETKTNKIGFIGGLNDNIGTAFLSGYAAGTKMINKEAYIGLINYENVRYTEDFKDQKKAYIKAKELYESGCDIIFHACGSAGEGVFKAAKEMNKKVIGVDVDCSKEYKEYEKVIMSSMLKAVDKAIVKVGKEIQEGTFKSGIENKTELGVKDEFIDYAPNTKDKVSKKTYIKLVNEKAKVSNGEIKIPEKIFEVIEFNGG